MQAAARNEAYSFVRQAGKERAELSAKREEAINKEVAQGVTGAGDLIKSEIQLQIDATNRNIEALEKNTAALLASKAQAMEKVKSAEARERSY